MSAQAAGAARVSPATASEPTASTAAVAVLDVVMLVDESGSETPAKVADEKRTAGTIAQTMLSPRSRVTVIGFGGVNNVVPDQIPVDVVCQPTVANGAANLSYLASCVNGLHRRTEAQGDDTDYAAALGQAMTYFNPRTAYGKQSPAGAIKVVLMMTDGGVDVHRNTQQYGTNWMLGERQAVALQLEAARQDGVQVWPLGFGTDITSQAASYLSQLAKDGAQLACDSRPESQPHYQVVNNPADAVSALDELYADASCTGLNTTGPTTLGGGIQAGVLRVTIPAIASGAAISVDRGGLGVQVSYQMPGGQQWTNSSAISGQGSPVEVLHLGNITAAETGTWTIKLTAAPGLASQLVKATVVWQGAVRALMIADPPSVRPGQLVTVTLSVLGPNGPLTDPSALSQLKVGVLVSGAGQTGATPVPVTNAGETPNSPTGVGDYKGTFTAPQAQGALTFTGTAAGYGLYATKAPATVQVTATVPRFIASVEPPVVSSVQTGASIRGQVTFVNETGAARNVRLEIKVSHALAAITSPAGPLTVSAGNPPAVPFTITFSKDSPAGLAWLEVRAVDAANPGLVYSDVPLLLTVATPPGFWAARHWLIDLLGGGALLVLLLALTWLWLRYADVRGLIAILRRDGEQAGRELVASNKKWAYRFCFIIQDSGHGPSLEYPESGPEYALRRTWRGEGRLRTPDGPSRVVVDGPGVFLADGSELAFRDTRPLRGVRRPAMLRANRDGAAVPGVAGQAGPSTADQNEAAADPSGPEWQNPWL